MPLVGRMLEELVFALPPLGDSKVHQHLPWHASLQVLDLLGGAGQASVAVLQAYPRCQDQGPSSLHRARVTLLERCGLRVVQAREALGAMVPPGVLDTVYQQEVRPRGAGGDTQVDPCTPGSPPLPGGALRPGCGHPRPPHPGGPPGQA